MPWPLPSSDQARLTLAKGYPYAAPAGSYLYRDGETRALDGGADAGLLRDRVPVIAHGSNRAPEQLHRKFSHLAGAASEIPVTRAVLADHDVVYSAHMTRYGAVSATLHTAPGTRVTVFVTWLSEAQLPRMHETELGLGNYGYGRMDDIALAIEGGPEISEAYAYLSVHGCLADPEAAALPVALAAVPAEDRVHRSLDQESALALLRDRHEPAAELDGMILSNIADTDKRRRLIKALQDTAVPWQVPGFELLQR
ncbi:hypothetical protein HBA54_21655 [Pelagibius litoralis]|uniref:Uncharacterized protein n=1 Tax=Pelagibius litoralis TaxID=374515 RepID=A0A967F189_9PROT|nr:hypothetical protein [Pelagibius litoralis]NIA71210.1 hypothetical protein [Pelagibius litoralis]